MVVDEQPIDVTLPADSVRLLLVQPFLQLQEPLQEPFPPSAACAARLAAAIDSVFQNTALHHPHIVLFPEFSIPGVQGVRQVAARLSSAAVDSPTIVIGGVSGLTQAAFTDLCGLPEVAVIDLTNAPTRVAGQEWVNTSVTFVKDDAGNVRLWLQPKLSPSWPETHCHHQTMFKGGLVRIFRARFNNEVPFRFFSLLCFDWVGQENQAQIPDALVQQYNEICRTAKAPTDLQWVFVLQHNQSPNHVTFLTATQRFLTQAATAPFVRRKDTAVVMVATATSQHPARGVPDRYGYSSLVFGPQAPFDSNGCWPTFATQSSRLRQSQALATCKDVVFREMGECIHLADVRIPNFVVADPTDRTAALVRAEAFPLVGTTADPRIPSGHVPAVVKWANDELDEVPDLCTTYFGGTPIEPAVRTAHEQMVDGYRRLESQDLALRIDGSCAERMLKSDGRADPAADVDTGWDADVRRGFRHVIQTLTLLGSAAAVTPVGSRLHARGGDVEIAAIAGMTHAECVKAFKKLAERTHSPIVFVSRDDENAIHLPREAESFADPRGGSGVKLTDAQTLLTAARSKTQIDYQQFVAGLMNVEDRRII
jgi:hypothetical protein